DVQRPPRETQTFPVGPEDVGRAGVAGSLGTDVLAARQTHEQNGKGDRSEKISETDEARRGRIHARTSAPLSPNVHSRSGVWTAPAGARRLWNKAQERSRQGGKGHASVSLR